MKLALCISGGGTTAEAIIKACQSGRLRGIEPACVIASKSGIQGIQRAEGLGMDPKNILVLHPKEFASREEFGRAMLDALKSRGVEILGQYGWLLKTPENVLRAYEGRTINQHPGPLDTGRPDFGGKGMFGQRVHAARLFFVRRVNRDFFTEATAHRVEVEYDTGRVIKRKVLEILPQDTVSSLQERLLPLEHEVQIEALQDMQEGRVQEFMREMPLVREGEEKILLECKAEAIKEYPEG